MRVTGFLLWLVMSTLIWYVGLIIFRFSIFQKEYWIIRGHKIKVSDMKFIILIILSEIVMLSYIRVNTVLGIFGYFQIFVYPTEDGILSGLLVSGGSSFIYKMYQVITNYSNLLNSKKELLNKAKENLKGGK